MSANKPGKAVVHRALYGHPSLADVSRIADALKVPAWILLIPGLHQHKDLLSRAGLRRGDRLYRRARS